MGSADKIKLTTKHLKKGDPLPPWNGILRVYNMRYCPFAHRTILALNAKQIEHEIINIDLMNKPEWLLSKSNFGKVPALEIEEGICIYESLVTVEYLDDVYQQRPLLPKDPVKKAFDKIIVEAADPIRAMYFKAVKFPESINEDNITAYHKALDFIREQLKTRGTTFLDGSEPGYADYMMWPWFERLRMLDDERVKIEGPQYDLLVEYFENMVQDPAVNQYILSKETYQKFQQQYRTGTLNIDSLEN